MKSHFFRNIKVLVIFKNLKRSMPSIHRFDSKIYMAVDLQLSLLNIT